MRWRQNFPRARRSKPARRLLRSLSNEDGDSDGNEKGKKAIGLQLCHAFLYISLLSLHDYNVKVPDFTLRRVREHKTMTFFFTFPGLWYSLRIQLQKICQHLTNWASWNKCDEVWGGGNSLFKWRFRSHRRRCCLSSLMQEKERMDKLEEDWSGLQLMVFETLLA